MKTKNIRFLWSSIFGNNVDLNEIDINNKIFLKKNIIIATLPIFRLNYNNILKTLCVESYKNSYDKFYNTNKLCIIFKLNDTDIIRGYITDIDYNKNIIFYYMKSNIISNNNYYELYVTNNKKFFNKNKLKIF
jgi:hypothetical protein